MTTDRDVKISQLRQRSMQALLETMAVILACVFVLLILPSLLIRYVYAGQQLFEQPPLLDYIQVAAFAVGAIHFVLTMLGNFMREAQVRALERGMMNAPVTAPVATRTNRDMASAMASVSKPATRTSRSKKTSRRK